MNKLLLRPVKLAGLIFFFTFFISPTMRKEIIGPLWLIGPDHFLPTDEWIKEKGKKEFKQRCKTPENFEPGEFESETITVTNALRFPENIKLYAYSPEKRVEIQFKNEISAKWNTELGCEKPTVKFTPNVYDPYGNNGFPTRNSGFVINIPNGTIFSDVSVIRNVEMLKGIPKYIRNFIEMKNVETFPRVWKVQSLGIDWIISTVSKKRNYINMYQELIHGIVLKGDKNIKFLNIGKGKGGCQIVGVYDLDNDGNIDIEFRCEGYESYPTSEHYEWDGKSFSEFRMN